MFDKISNIKYDITNTGKVVDSKNIFRFAYILDSYKEAPSNYIQHTLKSSETIEELALKYYGNPNYAWVILMYNDILDVYEELPKDDSTFREYVGKKYFPQNPIVANRILPLPLLSRYGTTLAGKYHGQTVYDESIDRGVTWDDPTQNWNPLPSIGYPKPDDRTFVVTCNDFVNPDDSSSFLIDGNPDPDLILFRGATYTFRIEYSPTDDFYFTTDSGRNWGKYNYNGSYIEGLKELEISGEKRKVFKVPDNAPDTLYYSSHRTNPIVDKNRRMSGLVRIRNIEDVSYVSQSDRNALQNINGRVIGKVAKLNEKYYIWNGRYSEVDETNFRTGWDQLLTESTGSVPFHISLGLFVARRTPHQYLHSVDGHIITPATYSLLPTRDRRFYISQSKYEYEEDNNEKNRSIKIMKQPLLGKFLEHWEKVVA